MASIRSTILEGKWHPSCERCKKDEAAGGISRRLSENNQNKDVINNNSDYSINNNSLLSVYDLRFGNKCNLRCRMCSPYSSNMIANEFIKYEDDMFYKFNDHPLIEKSLEQIFKKSSELKKIQTLKLAGGKPLLQKQCIDLIDILIQKNYSEKISLTITTNMTIANQKWAENFNKFKKIKLLLSLDSIGTPIEYIRKGLKWNTIDNNINFLMKNLDPEKTSFIFVPCIQALNILESKSIYEYVENIKKEYPLQKILISPSILRDPDYLAVNALSKKFIRKAKLHLENLYASYKENSLFNDYEKIQLKFNIKNVTFI